jgi:uncharacterized protein YdbL (DUF1318 family)
VKEYEIPPGSVSREGAFLQGLPQDLQTQQGEYVMLKRSLSVAFAALALAVVLSQTVRAEDATHEGTVVKAGDGTLVMTDKDGKNEHTMDVAKDAKITCDSKVCKLADLKSGSTVIVTTRKDDKDKIWVSKIEATSKSKK